MRCPLLTLFLTLQLLASVGQSSAGAGESISAAMQRVYRLTQTADSEADFEEIIGACRQTLEAPAASGDAAYAQQLLSWALNRRGELRWDRAENGTEFQRAEDDFERSVQLDATRWRATQNLAIAAARAGRLQEALRLLDRVVAMNPGYASAYFNRAEVRFELQQYEQSAADYSHVLRLDPRDADSLNGRAHAQFQTGEENAALRDFAAAVAADPARTELRIDLADALQSLGRWHDAAVQYRAAISNRASADEARLRLAWLLATCPAAQVRDLGEAAALAAAAGADSPLAVELAAVLAAEGGDFAEAARLQRRALELAPAHLADAVRARLELYENGRTFRLQPRGERAPSRLATGGGVGAGIRGR